MKLATFLLLLFVCMARPAAGEEAFGSALHRPSAPHPALYSFSDLYRLAVSGPAVSAFPVVAPSEAPVRTAVSQPAVQFSVSEAREPRLGLLLLAGVALAMWVARRRLGYAF
jgi:hypothetical protein